MEVRIEDVVAKMARGARGAEDDGATSESESEEAEEEELPIDEIEAFQRAEVYAEETREDWDTYTDDDDEDDSNWFAQ